MADRPEAPDLVSEALYHLATSDPDGRLIDRSGIAEEDVQQIGELMTALARLRDAERALNDASLEYMKLNRNDMRAPQSAGVDLGGLLGGLLGGRQPAQQQSSDEGIDIGGLLGGLFGKRS